MSQEILISIKQDLNQLKQAYQFPDIYIWNHFSTIKNEIDLCANDLLLNRDENDPSTNQIINVWIEMIKSIDSFQTECLNQLPIQFSDEISI